MEALETVVARSRLLPGQGKICIPKSVVELTPNWKQSIGLHEEGSVAQYRYGTYHAHDHGDSYCVHIDKVDPDKDPIGHLREDAPEVWGAVKFVGACALIGVTAWAVYKLTSRGSEKLQSSSIPNESPLCMMRPGI